MTVTITDPSSPGTSPERRPAPLRFTAGVNELRDALAWVAYALPSARRAPQAVLLGVRLTVEAGALTLSATDYSMQATATVSTPGGAGSALVPGAALQRILAALPKGSGIKARQSGDVLTITGGNEGGEVEYLLPLMNLADYPADMDRGELVVPFLSGLALADLARATVAAGGDYTLPVLTTVELKHSKRYGTLTAAATDRYRLAVAVVPDTGWPEDLTALVPAAVLARAAGAMRKDVNVSIWHARTGVPTITFTSGARSLTARTELGLFPAWESLVPDEFPAGIDLDRGATLEALTAVEAVLYRNDPVRVHVQDGQPVRFGVDPKSEAQSTATIAGASPTGFPEPTVLAFNPAFLRDGLKALRGPDVAIDVTSPTRPIIIRQRDDSHFLYLLMPVRFVS